MKIIIFGAAGGIGKYIVNFALEKNYKVVAYIRDSETLEINDDNLEIVRGELSNFELIVKSMEGCQAVINAVGVPLKFKYASMFAFEGTKNIVRAMNTLNIKRIVTWATPSVHDKEDIKSTTTIVPTVMASLFLPMAKKEITLIVEEIVKNNLDYTIVRFMAPKNTDFKKEVKVSFGEKLNFNISRADIAYFMINQVEDNKYLNRMPIIGS